VGVNEIIIITAINLVLSLLTFHFIRRERSKSYNDYVKRKRSKFDEDQQQIINEKLEYKRMCENEK
jgi:FtsZ-interacting cell division protein ZipA